MGSRDLLNSLPERKLGRRVHFMPGFYIAAVGETDAWGRSFIGSRAERLRRFR